MKKVALHSLVLASALFAVAASAQQKMDDMKGMDMMQKPTAGAQMVHKAAGTVNTIDAKAGIVTLAHGPVKTMNWPAMTMGFKVKDRMLLASSVTAKRLRSSSSRRTRTTSSQL